MVVDYGFSILNHAFSMSVHCPTSDRPYGCRIDLKGVISFHLDADYPSGGRDYIGEPWSYIELTSVEAEAFTKDGEQLWRFSAELWSSVLEVICCEMEVTRI
jgi:hypothetical protein